MKSGSSLLRLIVASTVVLFLIAFGASQLMFVSAENGADTKEPGDVTTLSAKGGDGEITLTWSVANDDVGVTGYKIYMGSKAVGGDGDTYDLPTLTTENVATYSVKNLTNDKPYFFSVTALDAAGNESANYSPEASATPKAAAASTPAASSSSSASSTDTHGSSVEDNGKAPQVNSVTSVDNVTVSVVFSEPVKLPEEQPASAFSIITDDTHIRLSVQKAEINSSDSTGSTVLLTTAPQSADTKYVLTAGIELKDLSDNPVISGTSDTGSFMGKAAQVAEVTTQSDTSTTNTTSTTTASNDINPDLKIISGTADFKDRMEIVFSQAVQLPNNPLTALSIVEKGTTKKLNVLNVSLSVDGATIYIITEKQNPVEYEVTLSNIKDEKGKLLALDTKYIVTAKGVGEKDTTPPEDVTDFIAKVKNVKKSIIELKWKPSVNSAGDLADYTVYQGDGQDGKDQVHLGEGSSLGSNTTSVEVQNLKAGQWYTFKMTAKDTTGNESKGILSTVYLPETGPGMLAAGLTGLAMGWYKKRKNKKSTRN